MVTFRYGSIFDGYCRTVAIPVNCIGVMGKGLALDYKTRFPNGFSRYRELCQAGELKPGVCALIKEDGISALMFPTKTDWKLPSKAEYIESGLDWLLKNYERLGIESIALPALGCGLGGLDWNDVKKMIVQKFANESIKVAVYIPPNIVEVSPFASTADTIAPVEVKEALIECIIRWFQRAGVYESPNSFEAMRILFGRAYALVVSHTAAIEGIKKDHGKAEAFVEKAIGLNLISNAY